MQLIIDLINNLPFLALGYGVPSLAEFCANKIAKKPLRQSVQPKEMLGTFYKSQALKLALFTIFCLVIMLIAKDQSGLAMIGISTNVLFNKRIFNRIKKDEPKPAYSH